MTSRFLRNRWVPAMEFGDNHIDESQPIITLRDQGKWAIRVAVGDVIQIAWSQMKQRRFAVVEFIDYSVSSKGARHPYPANTQLMEIRLRVLPGADETHPRYVTWETKTTELHRMLRGEA